MFYIRLHINTLLFVYVCVGGTEIIRRTETSARLSASDDSRAIGENMRKSTYRETSGHISFRIPKSVGR